MPEVRIDFLTGAVEPAALATPPVREAVAHYSRWLPDLLRSQHIDPAVIRSARLTLSFDYDRVRRTRYEPVQEAQEFACRVELTDDRAVVHTAAPDHWWAV